MPKVVKFNDIKAKNRQRQINKALLSNDELIIASLYSEELINEFRKNKKNVRGKSKNDK